MNPYLRFGLAGEPLAWGALALSAALFVAALLRPRVRDLDARSIRGCLALLAAAAALLSWGYIVHYLRGGPRIVDAAHYLLQARTFASGSFTFAVPEPIASFTGRFLLQSPHATLGVLFPPGYPAALAAAVWVGAPLALGPVIAAGLVPATYWLARELGATPRAALGASVLSVLCAALRYHTADTMSHGFSALLATLTLAAAARAREGACLLSGACAGWLVATRPVTGVVMLIAAVALACRSKRNVLWLAMASVPGMALVPLYQLAVTGDAFTSTQLAYYSVADGPPGCFRFGLGAGIGCLFEHGDFVRARLPDGYGVVEAGANTLRRLGVHTLDIANAAPLALLVPYGAWLHRRQRAVPIVFAAVSAVLVGYAFFYFEASYPGGGARLFADVLPMEHAFIACALASRNALRFAWPLALAGFALHTHVQHAALRDREGGRPMFEPQILQSARVTAGLVFVSTDHGFALGHDPRSRDARSGIVVARWRNDALDGLLWERLGRPNAFHYRYDPSARGGSPRVIRIPEHVLRTGGEKRRIEGESLWPPLSVSKGWAHPDYPPASCVSKGRGLRLRGTHGVPHMIVRLPDVHRPTNLVLGWIPDDSAAESRVAAKLLDSSTLALSNWTADPSGCWRSHSVGPLPVGRPLELQIEGSGVLDYIELSSAAPKDVDN